MVHPPLTVLSQAIHPGQGEGRQGGHPPGQEDSAAKLFWSGQLWSSLTPSRTGSSTSVREKEIRTPSNTSNTPPISSILTGRMLGRKLDRKEEEGRGRKMKHNVRKQENTRKKRTTYLLGPESETSPVPPRSSSSEPARASRWSQSSSGCAEARHTPGCSLGKSKGDQGSQDIIKEDINSPTLHVQNCMTAAHICTARTWEGSLNSGGGKTTALPDTDLQTNGKDASLSNLNTAVSLATEHQCHDGCNSQGGLQGNQHQHLRICPK